MAHMAKSSQDIILRTNRWAKELQFYETALGFKFIYSERIPICRASSFSSHSRA
jgi:hypothetical protein